MKSLKQPIFIFIFLLLLQVFNLFGKTNNLVVSVDICSLLQSVLTGCKVEYSSLWKWGVIFRCNDENAQNNGYGVQLGVFENEEQAKEMFRDILLTRSSLYGADMNSPIGNERMISKSKRNVIFRRDNVLIEIKAKEIVNLQMVKELDKKLLNGNDGIQRGNDLIIPVITDYELCDNVIMALTKPKFEGYSVGVDGKGHPTSDLGTVNSICFATKGCVMARPFQCDEETLRERISAEQTRRKVKDKMSETEFRSLVEILESPDADLWERKNAILLLGQSKDEQAVSVLVTELDKLEGRSDPVLRCLTIRALGMLHSQNAVRRLELFLCQPPQGDIANEDNDPSGEAIDRREAVSSLGMIGGAKARKVLESVSRSNKEYLSVRKKAAYTIKHMR